MDKLRAAIICLSVLYLPFGAVILGFGGVTKAYLSDIKFESNLYHIMAHLLIAIGSMLIVACVSGFMSACMNNKWIILDSFIGHLVVIGLEIIAFAVIFGVQATAKANMETLMSDSLTNYNSNSDSKAQWDSLHQEVQCCGVDGFRDWKKVGINSGNDVPESCCHIAFENCGRDALILDNPEYPIYNEGCLKFLDQKMSDMKIFNSIFAAISLIFQVINTVLLWKLWKRVKENSS